MKTMDKMKRMNATLLNFVFMFAGGLIFVLGVIFGNSTSLVITNGIGLSFVSTGLVSMITTRALIKVSQAREVIEQWGMLNIYETRAVMNETSNLYLEKCGRHLDIIAIGMQSFIDAKGRVIEDKISKGVAVRILTCQPHSACLAQREKDESRADVVTGAMKVSVLYLPDWLEEIRGKHPNANVEIRYYDTYPAYSYLRIDEHVFWGPNLFEKASQQAISFEFGNYSKGANYFSEYFEELWNNRRFCSPDIREPRRIRKKTPVTEGVK